MNNNSKTNKEKINTIGDYSHGEWICFLLPNNKKCVGNIIEIMIPSKENNSFFDSFKIVNYIDEEGMSGSVKVSEIKPNQRVIGLDINAFFNSKFSLKVENIQIKNESRKIARSFLKQSSLKRLGKIHKN